ncbi:MAG: PE-PPE domain-containing protein [Mycobacterium sp.]
MTAALPFMALPLTLAGPLPTSAAASANSTASAGLVPPGPATVLHTSPTPWSVPNHLDGVFCADTRVCQEVYYQAIQSYGPIELGLAENVEALDFAINHASGDKVAYGFSGGARVVSAWLERQAESNSVSPDDTNIVLLGNSGRKYGGINGFFWGNLFNILMTPTDTDYNVLDVARQFDPIADFPDNPFNLLALANAVAAFTNTHLTYSQAELEAPGNYVWKEGNTTYVYIPTAQLPILQGLRDLGLGTLADQLEAPLRKMIEPAYTRDYLENATVIPAPAPGEEAEAADSVQSASSAIASQTGVTPEAGAASEAGLACSGYRTDGCDILAEQSYSSVTAPDLENPAWENVLPNLFNAVLGIPRAYLDGLNDLSHALEVTGSWWVYTPTNVLGYDPADPPKITAITNLTIPFPALSNPLGEHVSWWAKANLPMDAGCTGTAPPTCTDANSILSKMFQAPLWDFFSGYQFPELINPVSDAEGAGGTVVRAASPAQPDGSGVQRRQLPVRATGAECAGTNIAWRGRAGPHAIRRRGVGGLQPLRPGELPVEGLPLHDGDSTPEAVREHPVPAVRPRPPRGSDAVRGRCGCAQQPIGGLDCDRSRGGERHGRRSEFHRIQHRGIQQRGIQHRRIAGRRDRRRGYGHGLSGHGLSGHGLSGHGLSGHGTGKRRDSRRGGSASRG